MAKATTEIAEAFTREDDESYQEYSERKSDELQSKAAGMNIKRYEPRDKPGVYDDEVDTLLQVDEQTGYQNEIEILVPEADVAKHKRYFAQSAAKRGKTSRIVNGEKGVSQGDHGRLLAFVLVDKVHRKPKDVVPVTETDDSTPEKVA